MRIFVEPLTANGFKPFGDVIEASQAGETANLGMAKRSNLLTQLENTRPQAQANVCVFKTIPRTFPVDIKLLERHVHSTQMFVPMTDKPASYLVIVAQNKNEQPDLTTLRAFVGHSKQAFNYKRGIWHHPMICLESNVDFACLVYEMREKCKDPKEDCEEFFFTDPITIENVIRPVATKSFLPLNTFQSYPDLASDSNGGRILFSTDDFFAVAENMISHTAPVWDEQKYTVFGKWMDGWETRRKRTLGHDWCIIELGLSGEIVGIDADTAFFTGNNVPAISIQAYNSKKSLPLKRRSEMGTRCTQEELDAAEALQSHKWKTILEKTSLRPGYQDTRHHVIRLSASGQWTHLRVNIFPDGGIARLRVYGEVVPDWSKVSVPCDLVGLENGGAALEWSNAHYGSPMQLLQKQRSLGMFDGWETARNPHRPSEYLMDDKGQLIIPGNEWAILRLGHRGIVQKLIVDTNHYKGNYPESCEILCCDTPQGPTQQTKWLPLISRTKLGPHKEHPLDSEFLNPITHVKLIMYPDGGISRLRLIGYPIQQARF